MRHGALYAGAHTYSHASLSDYDDAIVDRLIVDAANFEVGHAKVVASSSPREPDFCAGDVAQAGGGLAREPHGRSATTGLNCQPRRGISADLADRPDHRVRRGRLHSRHLRVRARALTTGSGCREEQEQQRAATHWTRTIASLSSAGAPALLPCALSSMSCLAVWLPDSSRNDAVPG